MNCTTFHPVACVKVQPFPKGCLFNSKSDNYLIMGRKAYFARLDDQAKERRRLRRQMNGYVPGAHKKEDAVRNKDKKLPKTKELHQQTLDLWFE